MLLACWASDILVSLVVWIVWCMFCVWWTITLLLNSALIDHHVVLLTLSPIRGWLLGQSETSLRGCGAGKVLAALSVRFSCHRSIIGGLVSSVSRLLRLIWFGWDGHVCDVLWSGWCYWLKTYARLCGSGIWVNCWGILRLLLVKGLMISLSCLLPLKLLETLHDGAIG